LLNFHIKGHNANDQEDPTYFQNNPDYPVNICADAPRAAAERLENREAYLATTDVLGPIFEWVKKSVREIRESKEKY
jgi:hypothetical protein